MIRAFSSSTTTEPRFRPSGSRPSSTMKLVGDQVAPAGTEDDSQDLDPPWVPAAPLKHVHDHKRPSHHVCSFAFISWTPHRDELLSCVPGWALSCFCKGQQASFGGESDQRDPVSVHRALHAAHPQQLLLVHQRVNLWGRRRNSLPFCYSFA